MIDVRGIVGASLLLFCASSYSSNDHDTVGNVQIKDMNIWDGHVDIYLADEQQHQCSGGLKTRFVINPEKQAFVSVLLMSFASGKKVNLAYDCGTDNYPWIVGVRVKGS